MSAATNFIAGTLSDRFGRKPVLVAGWIVAIPIPLLLIWAHTWGWVIVANVRLGVTRLTRPHDLHHELTTGEIFTLTSFREKALSACCQAGLVNILNDGLAWGLFPIFFAMAGLSVGRIGILAAIYPAI